jgi:hypothetical protein
MEQHEFVKQNSVPKLASLGRLATEISFTSYSKELTYQDRASQLPEHCFKNRSQDCTLKTK